jgi:hypothetical protein
MKFDVKVTIQARSKEELGDAFGKMYRDACRVMDAHNDRTGADPKDDNLNRYLFGDYDARKQGKEPA